MNTRPSSRRDVSPPTPELETVEDDDVGHGGIDGYPVQVVVKGIVYTQEKPSIHSADANMNCAATETMPLFQEDPRRKEVALWCENFPIYFGTNRQMVTAGQSAHLPTGGSATIRHQDAVWVRGDGGTALVSYIAELYAD